MAKQNLASMFAPVVKTSSGGRLDCDVDMDLESGTMTLTMEIPTDEVPNFATSDALAARFGTTDKGNSTIASARETILKLPDGTEVIVMANVFAKRPARK